MHARALFSIKNLKVKEKEEEIDRTVFFSKTKIELFNFLFLTNG